MLSRSSSLAGLVALGLVTASGSAGAAYSSEGALPQQGLEVNKGIPTNITTPEFGPAAVKVKASINVEPVKNGGPMIKISLQRGAILQARWSPSEVGRLKLVAKEGSSNDGTVAIRHTIAPVVSLNIDLTKLNPSIGFTQSFNWDATDLINGNLGQPLNYDSQGTANFLPWGWTPTSVTPAAPALANSKLFGFKMAQISKTVGDVIDGSIDLYLTNKSTFTYKTTKIGVAGADNGNTVITAAGGEVGYKVGDPDYLDVTTSVEGTMTVNGTLSLEPGISIAQVNIGGSWKPVNSTFKYDVFDYDYTTNALPVSFPNQIVHIPLPNTKVPGTAQDIGSAKSGKNIKQIVKIQNTGELEAETEFLSSNEQFVVPSGKIRIPAKSTYDLEVSFTPKADGPATAEITMNSDDPDSPVQTFKVGGNGAITGSSSGASGTSGGSTNSIEPASDSGCGCRVAGVTDDGHSSRWALVGLGALGAALAFRRRKRN
jgi:MYXO-CTERM domain-containing protein